MLGRFGDMLTSPLRALRRASSHVFSPGHQPPPLPHNDNAPDAPNVTASHKRRRSFSDEISPNMKLRKTPRTIARSSVKRPRCTYDINQRESSAKRLRPDDNVVRRLFSEKAIDHGRRTEEIVQRKDERRKWCQAELNRCLSDHVDKENTNPVPEGFIPSPDLKEIPTPLGSVDEEWVSNPGFQTPIRPIVASPSLRRSTRKSAKVASRRISMQLAPGGISPSILALRVEQRKVDQANEVQKRIRLREEKAKEQAQAADIEDRARDQWKSIVCSRLAGRLEGKSPVQILLELCPASKVDPYSSTSEQVKKAIKTAMTKFHPDRTQRLPVLEHRVEAEEVFKILQRTRESIDERYGHC